MPACQYEEWNRDKRALECCGEPATELATPFARGRMAGKSCAYLCALHRAFVLDALNTYEIESYSLKKKQKAARMREQIKQLQMELKTGDFDVEV